VYVLLKIKFHCLVYDRLGLFGIDSFNFSSVIPFLELFPGIKLLFIYYFLLEIYMLKFKKNTPIIFFP